MTGRFLQKSVFLLTLALTACDSEPPITLQFRNDALLETLIENQKVSLAFDVDDGGSSLVKIVQETADRLTKKAENPLPVTFSYERRTDLGPPILRLAINPPENKTAISLCRGGRIGRASPRSRSLIAVAALCYNGRRVVAVRSVLEDNEKVPREDLSNFFCALITRSLNVNDYTCFNEADA